MAIFVVTASSPMKTRKPESLRRRKYGEPNLRRHFPQAEISSHNRTSVNGDSGRHMDRVKCPKHYRSLAAEGRPDNLAGANDHVLAV